MLVVSACDAVVAKDALVTVPTTLEDATYDAVNAVTT